MPEHLGLPGMMPAARIIWGYAEAAEVLGMSPRELEAHVKRGGHLASAFLRMEGRRQPWTTPRRLLRALLAHSERVHAAKRA